MLLSLLVIFVQLFPVLEQLVLHLDGFQCIQSFVGTDAHLIEVDLSFRILVLNLLNILELGLNFFLLLEELDLQVS